MTVQLPSKPLDLSVKPVQHGYSNSFKDSKHEAKYHTPATPYFNSQIDNPNNNGRVKAQAFLEQHTDDQHMKQYAKKGAKWLFNNVIKKQFQ